MNSETEVMSDQDLEAVSAGGQKGQVAKTEAARLKAEAQSRPGSPVASAAAVSGC